MITFVMDDPQLESSQNVFQVTEEVNPDSPGVKEIPASPPPQNPAPEASLTPDFSPPDGGDLSAYVPGNGGVGRIILMLLILIIIVGGVVLAINFLRNRGTGNNNVTLTYWGLWEDESTMQPLITDFQNKNKNISIKYILQSQKQYRERLEAALQRGGEVDIFRFHNTWVPMLKEELSLIPENIFSKKDFESTFYPVVKNDLKLKDGYAGIPLMFDGLALFYNEDILNAAGVSVPKTWDELQETSLALTVKDTNGEIKTAGIALGTANNIEHFSDILAVMFLQNDADLKNPSTAEASEALAFYRMFAEKPNNTWDEVQENSITAFASGKVAMIFAPSWEAFTISSKNPNLKFKTAPIPQLPGTNINWASYWVEGVSNKSANQKAAWEFLKFLSEKENMQKLYTLQMQSGRAFGEPYSRTDMAQSLTDNPILGAFILQAPQSRSFPLASRTYDNGINDRLIKYLEDAVNSLSTGGSPESALSTASRGFQQILSQYGLVAAPNAATPAE